MGFQLPSECFQFILSTKPSTSDQVVVMLDVRRLGAANWMTNSPLYSGNFSINRSMAVMRSMRPFV